MNQQPNEVLRKMKPLGKSNTSAEDKRANTEEESTKTYNVEPDELFVVVADSGKFNIVVKESTKTYNVEPDELFATMKNSGKFNIIVEGPTDSNIYDRLITSLGIQNIDYYIAGCREDLFKIYRRIKREDPTKRQFLQNRVAFIADQDSWVFLDKKQKPPEGYEDICMEDIIWTEGYSIENDLYMAGSLRTFVGDEYSDEYNQTLDSICTWYAFEVNRRAEGENLHVGMRLPKIVPENSTELAKDLREEIEKEGFNCLGSRYKEIRDDYKKLIRGKTLFQLLLRFLKKSQFPANYSDQWHNALALMAITIGSNLSPSPLIEDLEKKVKCKLSKLQGLSNPKVHKLFEVPTLIQTKN